MLQDRRQQDGSLKFGTEIDESVQTALCLLSGTLETIMPVSNLSVRRVTRGDTEVKAHDLPGSALIQDDVLWTQVTMNHFNPTVEERQTL